MMIMTQNVIICVFSLLAVTIPILLHSHASSVPLFNGLNFDWCEQVQFYLGISDLDLALQIEKSTTITATSSDEKKTTHKL